MLVEIQRQATTAGTVKATILIGHGSEVVILFFAKFTYAIMGGRGTMYLFIVSLQRGLGIAAGFSLLFNCLTANERRKKLCG